MPPITLITDFGSKDHYVGVMKGRILKTRPDALIVDITHEIAPHNILHGAFVLRQAMEWFPQGTVHAVVVDPGVGSPRRILAARYSGQCVIAPDNGLLSFVHRYLRIEEIVCVENAHYFPGPVSPTFHGRDIIAPVAAHVASGLSLEQLGPGAGGIEVLKLQQPEHLQPVGLRGHVLFADHFGNLVTNLHADTLAELYRSQRPFEVWVADNPLGPVRGTYSDVDPQQPLALVGSSKMLEIAVNQGRADERFGTGPELQIIVRPRNH